MEQIAQALLDSVQTWFQKKFGQKGCWICWQVVIKLPKKLRTIGNYSRVKVLDAKQRSSTVEKLTKNNNLIMFIGDDIVLVSEKK